MTPPYADVVGVGFGPANLALAVALAEHRESTGERLSAVFLERQRQFGWHQGMLIDGATMQVCFLKDLATLRNPVSRFSFLNYLHDRHRLVEFVNHKTLYPSRVEFHDYLEWAAASFAEDVRYGAEVVEIRPVSDGGGIEYLDVVTKNDSCYRTRNVVLGTGITPAMPDGAPRSDRVWHSSELLDRLAEDRTRSYRRFVVAGAGQSAAESVAHLHGRHPDAEVHAVFTRYGYSPADDSSFANGVFDPAAVDTFFASSPLVKDSFYTYHANTNYSVVDLELIEELYRRVYQERVVGRERLHVANLSKLLRTEPGPDSVVAEIEFLPTGKVTRLDVDAVICATGYQQMDPTGLLGDLTKLCKVDGQGRLRVERDYRVATTGDLRCGIYLQGGTEHTHGLSASLLSNVSIRAGEIVESILG
jgi:L-ornithine N5-oxygenase